MSVYVAVRDVTAGTHAGGGARGSPHRRPRSGSGWSTGQWHVSHAAVRRRTLRLPTATACRMTVQMCHKTAVAGVFMSNHWRQEDEHDQQYPGPQDRGHRHLRGTGEEDDPQDARRGTGGGRGDVATPGCVQGHHGTQPQGREMEPVRRAPEVVRTHGRGQPGRLQLLLGPRLLHGTQQGSRRGQGTRGAAVAGFGRLHPTGAGRHGVRRGDDPDPTDRHRRDVRAAAEGAGRPGACRAHRRRRAGEPALPDEHRTRHRIAGVLGGLRPAAPRDPVGGRSLLGMSDDPFILHRSLLFTVAYEMLGSAVDAEDVVQETWLRWVDVDQSEVRDPRSYLVRIVTRKALDRLRALARQREEYVGEWLLEPPLLTSPDVAEDVELAESVSIAMLTVLETLGPAERAVFVLREVFDAPYDEIATALDKTPAAVRQIAHRAREHVAARRPRMQVDHREDGASELQGRRGCPDTCRGPSPSCI